MRLLPFPAAALLVLAACHASSDRSSPDPVLAPIVSERTPAITPDNRWYDRCEGTAYSNDCAGDAGCFLGGCSGEVCSAANNVVTTCLAVPWPPDGVACGCVEGQCIWYF